MKQDWFITQIITILPVIVGALLVILNNFWQEKSKRKTQVKLEKLKLYHEKKLKAYQELDEFISLAYSYYWPPNNLRLQFITLMKDYFFKKVRIHYPFYSKAIREKLKFLEDQYIYLDDPDLRPKVTFNDFLENYFLDTINELNKLVEKMFDDWDVN